MEQRTGEITKPVDEKWLKRFHQQMVRCDAYSESIRDIKAMLNRAQSELLKEKGKMDGLAQIFIEENVPEVDLTKIEEMDYTFDNEQHTFTLQVPEAKTYPTLEVVPIPVKSNGA